LLSERVPGWVPVAFAIVGFTLALALVIDLARRGRGS
jgi:hypothetical protein